MVNRPAVRKAPWPVQTLRDTVPLQSVVKRMNGRQRSALPTIVMNHNNHDSLATRRTCRETPDFEAIRNARELEA